MSSENFAVDDCHLSVRQPFKVDLIKFVRDHPELWDTSKSAYRNNTLKSNVWDKFMNKHPGLNSKQVREQWRLIKNRFHVERDFRNQSQLMGKDLPTSEFPYYNDCAFLENQKTSNDSNFGLRTRSSAKYVDESKDFLEDFRRVLSEASPEEDQGSPPQSDNDMENSAPGTHSTHSQSSERGPAETRAQLIDLVRDLPELYDKSNPLYKNNAHKGVLWTRIAKQLGNGATVSAKKVREQWSYMRRKYEEEFFSRKAGQAPTPMDPSKRHLFTFDQLSFLEPYMNNERPESPPDPEVSETDADPSEVSQVDDPFGIRSTSNLNELLWQLTSKNGQKSNNARVNPDTGEIVFEEKNATSGPPSLGNGVPPAFVEVPETKAPRSAKKRRIEETTSTSTSESLPKSTESLQRSVLHLSRCLMEVMPSREEDECAMMGKQVAVDLRTLSVRSRLEARKRINEVLMELLLQDQHNHSNDTSNDSLKT